MGGGKMRVLGVAVALAVAVCPAVSASEAEPAGCDAVVGAWEYEPSGTGRAVTTAVGDKITFAYVLKTGEAGAGEYTCEERDGKLRAEFTFLYHSDPSQVGSKPTLEIEVDGDEMRWWFLNADEEPGPVGAAKRVR
jgi:hypothetical protein